MTLVGGDSVTAQKGLLNVSVGLLIGRKIQY